MNPVIKQNRQVQLESPRKNLPRISTGCISIVKRAWWIRLKNYTGMFLSLREIEPLFLIPMMLFR